MNKHVKIVSLLLAAGFIIIAASRFLLPMWQDYTQKSTSDARATKGTITVAMDSWVGYLPLCSRQMKTRMRMAGYILECLNDQADYPERMAKLRKHQYQFAVATVDSYLLNGASENFPGVITAVIDESYGGDAIVAWKDTFANLDSLKKAEKLKIALTPNSPSEHLIKAAAVHFDIPILKDKTKKWQEPTEGSEEAFSRFMDREVAVAVLWEPDVSRALDRGKGDVVKLLGTEVTAKLVVDILLTDRDYAQNNPEGVKTLLANYFQTLKYFRDNPDELAEELRSSTGLSGDRITAMLQGVKWTSLTDNAQHWFGISSFGTIPEEGLIETIEGASRILVSFNDFQSSPLPDHNPYRITDSQFITELYQGGISTGRFTDSGGTPVLPKTAKGSTIFKALSETQWQRLRQVGTLQVRPIIFQSGTAILSYQGKLELDQAAESLDHYPNFRILIKGHTSTRGDVKANRDLSQLRADAVLRYLTITHSLDRNRTRAVGYGGSQPLSRQPGESYRTYNYRLPRVELVLVSEVF